VVIEHIKFFDNILQRTTMSDNKELYLTPKEMSKEVGISVYLLRYYRQQGHLPKTKWTPGGGKPLYEINEVKKLFHKN